MADSVREQKLAAARKKLRQFQKKKGTKRVIEGSSKEGTPDVEGSVTEESSPLSEAGTLSSHASSLDLASEEFTEMSEDAAPREDSSVSSHIQSMSQDLTNGENVIHASNATSQIYSAGTPDPASGYVGETEAGGSHFTTTDTTQMAVNRLELPEVLSTLEDENESHCTKISEAAIEDDKEAQLPNGEENNQEMKLAASYPLPVVENGFSNHDPYAFTTQSCSDIASTSPNLPQNEDFTNMTLIQSSEPDAHIVNTAESTTALQQVIPPTPVILDLPKDEPVVEILSSDFDATHEQQISSDSFEREGSVSSETTASVTTAIHISTGEVQGEPVLKSSSESLRQISLQLSGLMSESEESAPALSDSTISELERRNAELAAFLQQESQTSQQQAQYITQIKAQLDRSEAELNAARGILNSTAGGGVREVESLREQLEVHIQTIGILVSEKSELQSSLTHANYALKQKGGEVIELDGRLSASRQRVGEVEATLKDITSQRDATKSSQDSLSKQLDAAKMANFKTNKQCEDLKTSVAELTERLSVKTNDYDKLYSQLTDTKSQLAMAQLHVQQLRDGTSEEIQSQLEKVQAAHLESQRQLQAVQAALSQAHAEKSKVVVHYQQYTTQLAAQTQNLHEQMKQLMAEKEVLTEGLEVTKAKLEAAAQNIPSPSVSQEEITAQRENLNHTITTLQEEKLQLKEQNAALTNDNSQLSKLVDQLSCNVEELEMQIERSKTEEVDTSQLLAAMQSDKVAAARALSQNKQLKEQLEELQSGFIIMSNKKLELTEKLEKELHVRKALNQEIATLNEDMTNMRQQMVEKDREIVLLKENGESLGAQLMLTRRQSYHQNDTSQMTQEIERITKENAKYTEYLSDLEEKLRLSQVEIEELTKQNSELHNLFAEYGSKTSKKENLMLTNGNTSEETNCEENEGSGMLLTKVAALTSSLSKVEMDRSNLQSQLEVEKAKYARLLEESTAKQLSSETVITSQPTAADKNMSMENLLSLQEAHKALEERFSRSMQEVAELSDDKQSLEHVIMQLQVETETIGDYITIYQFQRGVMKQQARERELELSSLMHEREEMKSKLAVLQDLVSTLAQEKGPGHEQLIKMTNVIKNQTSLTSDIENGDQTLVNDTAEEEIAKEATENFTNGISSEILPVSQDNNPSTTNLNGSTNADMQDLGGDPLINNTGTKSPTVQRILDLLNEMEATSQVEHCGLQKFHPCPLCSGKLITV
ncbi:golgin subfamily A member 2-like isoform X2 [Homarus americanus]|uniref:golgin subfamily A member 2-like isoform X2 n=1 Tax=Homarus americanus TaxID=6706 RepID=UPI001C46119B|nr:golgin subfamily A member 2-like isoform X2 [Homarus americanus]